MNSIYFNSHAGNLSFKPKNQFFFLGKRNNFLIYNLDISFIAIKLSLKTLFFLLHQKKHILILNSNPKFIPILNSLAPLSQLISYSHQRSQRSIIDLILKWDSLYSLFNKLRTLQWIKNRKNNNLKSFKILNKKISAFQYFNSLKKPSFLIFLQYNKSFILQAKKLNIPILCFVQTNDDIEFIDYPIFINQFGVNFIFNFLIALTLLSNSMK